MKHSWPSPSNNLPFLPLAGDGALQPFYRVYTCLPPVSWKSCAPDSDHPVPVLRKGRRLEQWQAALPQKISYTEFVDTAMTCEIPISTGKRMLRRAWKT